MDHPGDRRRIGNRLPDHVHLCKILMILPSSRGRREPTSSNAETAPGLALHDRVRARYRAAGGRRGSSLHHERAKAGDLAAGAPGRLRRPAPDRASPGRPGRIGAAAGPRPVGQLYGERVLVDGPTERAHEPARYATWPSRARGRWPSDWLTRRGRPRHRRPGGCSSSARTGSIMHRPWNATARFLQSGVHLDLGDARADEPGIRQPAVLAGDRSLLGLPARAFPPALAGPELYDSLIDHARRGHAIEPAPFPATGVEILSQLVLWKREQLARSDPPSALTGCTSWSSTRWK